MTQKNNKYMSRDDRNTMANDLSYQKFLNNNQQILPSSTENGLLQHLVNCEDIWQQQLEDMLIEKDQEAFQGFFDQNVDNGFCYGQLGENVENDYIDSRSQYVKFNSSISYQKYASYNKFGEDSLSQVDKVGNYPSQTSQSNFQEQALQLLEIPNGAEQVYESQVSGQPNYKRTRQVDKIAATQQPRRVLPKRKFEDKNCCKYILQQALKTLHDSNYYGLVASICKKNEVDLPSFLAYFHRVKFQLTGYRTLKNELIQERSDAGDDGNNSRRMAFKEYLVWYLDNLATVHIFNGKIEVQNTKRYLTYKNQVMLYYARFPEQWNGNSSQLSSSFLKR